MSLKRNAFWGAIPPIGTPHVTSGVSDMLDCTTECRAKEHSLLVLSSAYLGNLKLLKHCATVCNNPLHILDALGRNALHVAASKGYLQLVLWLVARRKVKVDVFDWESKWTALHRSTYYGQLGAAALLMKVHNISRCVPSKIISSSICCHDKTCSHATHLYSTVLI